MKNQTTQTSQPVITVEASKQFLTLEPLRTLASVQNSKASISASGKDEVINWDEEKTTNKNWLATIKTPFGPIYAEDKAQNICYISTKALVSVIVTNAFVFANINLSPELSVTFDYGTFLDKASALFTQGLHWRLIECLEAIIHDKEEILYLAPELGGVAYERAEYLISEYSVRRSFSEANVTNIINDGISAAEYVDELVEPRTSAMYYYRSHDAQKYNSEFINEILKLSQKHTIVYVDSID